MKSKFIVFFLMLMQLGSFHVKGQQSDITGVVYNAKGEPLSGVTVEVKGTTTQAATGENGRYTISAGADETLVFFSVGMKREEVAVAGRKTIDVTLQAEDEQLEEVVVTALGIKREKRALGYTMQEVKAESMSENKSASVANLLQGKVAGAQIAQSGSGLGGSTRIVLRGLNSLSGNNQPLWVIDGIPVSDQQTSAPGEWGGLDKSGAASEINPDDIETISVLKGANAAALYGSRAQNGAIVITTKSGKLGQPLQIEYNGNVNVNQIFNSYEYQNVYSQGSNGEYVANSKNSWGEYMDGSRTVPNWRRTIYGDESYQDYQLLPQGDYIKDFYRTGLSYTNSLIATAGGENLTSRLSFTDTRNQGVTPNNSLNRQYYNLNTEYGSSYLKIGAKVNFIRQRMLNQPGQAEYGLMQQLIRMPRGIRLQDLKNPVGLDDYLVNWSGTNNEYLNPYSMIMSENGNQSDRNRIIGQINMSVIFNDHLKLTGRAGVDWMNDQDRVYSAYVQPSTTGSQYTHTQLTNQEFNADLMLNYDKTFNDFSVTANIGTAIMNLKSNSLLGSSGMLTIPALIAISNGQNQTVTEGYTKKEIHSVLGNAQIGYKNMAYLELTGRNDWSSTLPSVNWSYFYPSASLSAIATEIFSLPEQISYLKLRGSVAKVGNDTYAYRLNNPYGLGLVIGSVQSATISSTYPLYNLKPEETVSTEAGLELKMFNSRVGLDFTYYKSNTTNQIINVEMSPSSGYTGKSINAGKISSHGMELMLSGTPIQRNDWQWDVNVNWGKNVSECIALNETVKRYTLGTTRAISVVVDEGGKFGDIIGKGYMRDDQGNILVDDEGRPLGQTDMKIGNMLTDWTGSVGNSLSYKNISLSALVDIRHGGDFLSMTDQMARGSGNAKSTLSERDGIIVDGIMQSTGQANTTQVSAENYYSAVGGITEEFMYDASYIKLRELSVGYNLPSSWLRNAHIKSVKVSAVGRDLFFIHKNAPVNPESSLTRSDYAQAIEYGAIPPTRSFGLSLNVKF